MSGELYVLFRVGGAEYAVPARQIAQMESYAGATRVPGARPEVAGIVHVRGRVVPVVDLRVRFGLPAVPTTPDSRLVIVQVEDRQVGLLVDLAREVVRLAPEAIEPPPPMVATESRGMVRAIARVGTRVVMMVDADVLVGQEMVDAG